MKIIALRRQRMNGRSVFPLGLKALRGLSHEYLASVYRHRIETIDKSLLKPSNFREQLFKYYGNAFINDENPSIPEGFDKREWSENLLKINPNYGQAVHPVFHFLVWEFLDLGPDDFVAPVMILWNGKKPYKEKSPLKIKILDTDLGEQEAMTYEGFPVKIYFPFSSSDVVQKYNDF